MEKKGEESDKFQKVEKIVKKLNEGLNSIRKAMKELEIPEQVLEKDIKPFGNASHIILPKEYSNNKAKVIIIN
jgi:putative transposon-encoded protein